jgi:hypothetical protein
MMTRKDIERINAETYEKKLELEGLLERLNSGDEVVLKSWTKQALLSGINIHNAKLSVWEKVLYHMSGEVL